MCFHASRARPPACLPAMQILGKDVQKLSEGVHKLSEDVQKLRLGVVPATSTFQKVGGHAAGTSPAAMPWLWL